MAKDLTRKAERLLDRGKIDKAIEIFKETGDHEKLAEVYQQIGEHGKAGDVLEELGRLQEALECYQRSERWDRVSAIAERLGDLATAADAADRDGNFGHAGNLYQRIGDLDNAFRAYQEAGLKKKAAEVAAQKGDPLSAADLFRQEGDLASAAEALAQAGKLEEAAALFEEIESYKRGAECYLAIDEKAKAATLFEKAEEWSSATPLYEELGDFEKAGSLHEKNRRLYEAALMYERSEKGAIKAAEIFQRTYSGEQEILLEESAPVTAIAISPANGKIMAGFASGEAVLISPQEGLQWKLKVPERGQIRSLAASTDPVLFAMGTQNRGLYLMDENKNMIRKQRFPAEVRSVDISSDGHFVLVGCCNHKAYLFDHTKAGGWEFETGYKVWSVRLSPEKNHAAVGSGDLNVYLVDSAGKAIWRHNAGDWVHRVDLDEDGKYVVAGVGMSTVVLLERETGRLVWSYEHHDVVHDVTFLPGSSLMVLACNQTVAILNVDQEVLWEEPLRDRAMKVAPAPDGSSILLGHFKRGITQIALHDCKSMAAACFEKGGDLTSAASLFESDGNLQKAAELYQETGDYLKAADLSSKLGEQSKTAELYEEAGEFAKAAEVYEEVGVLEKAAECFSKAEIHDRAGEIYASVEKPLEAAQSFERANRFGKAGALFTQAGKTDEAVSAYERDLERQTAGPETYYNLGILYQERKEIDKAIRLFQHISSEQEYRTRTLERLAECFLDKQMYALAIDRYSECLGEERQVTPENIQVHYGLAYANEMAGNYPQTVEIFQRILAVDYSYKDVHSRLERVSNLVSVFGEGQKSSAVSGTPAGEGSFEDYQKMTVGTKSRYQILEKLGEGGMGVVYLAKDSKLDRTVAWKVLPSRFSDNAELRERFLREARAVAALNHQNIISVYDIGEEKGESFISMEFVEGVSLRDILDREPKLPIGYAVRLALQVADGLATAHSQGIIHRDIKPENVMLTQTDSTVKIMDFGLAHIEDASLLTKEGAVMGTWRYMSPEQIQGMKTDGRTDVYASGIMLFEMLAGKAPFVEGDLVYHHVHTPPPNLREIRPEVPEALEAAIMKCLAKDPADRYTASELRDALREIEPQVKESASYVPPSSSETIITPPPGVPASPSADTALTPAPKAPAPDEDTHVDPPPPDETSQEDQTPG